MEGTNNKERNKRTNPVLLCFCITFVVTLIVLVTYLSCSIMTMKDSQKAIVNEHINHVARIDSIFYEMKNVILSNDTNVIANSRALLTQLHNDSAMFRREVLLSQKEMNSLISLHIDKVENDYAQIGIWGGILSVIFIIFGFFAIFKIEETKTDANRILNDVEEQADQASNKIGDLQNQAAELNKYINSTKLECNTFLADKTKEFETLIKDIKDLDIEKTKQLLYDIEIKNKNYQWSVDMMNNQRQELEELINNLKIIDNERKEESNE
ncbi:MAG: hypothetical protein IKA00_04415 [Prevotella sp.]|nr:hypothetical protein [Prevotella sp.]